MTPVRSPKALLDTVLALDVERAEAYRARDVTGDGRNETWCNLFLADVTAALGCPVPKRLANAQISWLDSADGAKVGWAQIDAHEAEVMANEGYPVVAGWYNPSGHGHVAIGVPTPAGAAGLYIAQAGRINFSQRPVERGFGKAFVSHWGHD